MADKIYNIGSGQTYAMLSTARDQAITDGLTADDYYFRIHGDVTETSYAGFGDPLGFNVCNHVYIEAAPGQEHTGVPGTGASITKSVSSQWLIKIDVTTNSNITIRNLEIYETGSSGIAIHGDTTGSVLQVYRCIISAPTGIYRPQQNSVITSNLIIDCTTVGMNDLTSSTGKTFENNTIKDCLLGISGSASSYYNGGHNVWYGCTTDNSGTQVWNDGYNASTTGSPPGPNPIATALVSGDFVDAANDDMNVSGPSSTVYHAGEAGGGLLDIVGNTFDATNRSVGAFEYVPPGIFRTLSDNTTTYDVDSKQLSKSMFSEAGINDFELVGEVLLTSILSDVVSLYDTLLSSGALAGRFLSDSVSVSEASVRSLRRTRSILESLSITDDSISRIATVYREAAEALSILDDASLSMVIKKRMTSDAIDAEDFISKLTQSFRTLHGITDVEDRIDRALQAIRALQDETSIDDDIISSASTVLRTYVFILVNMR